MIPYFKGKSVKLFLGDSLELLKRIPAESVDIIYLMAVLVVIQVK